jgi:hypothetical protein
MPPVHTFIKGRNDANDIIDSVSPDEENVQRLGASRGRKRGACCGDVSEALRGLIEKNILKGLRGR